MDFRLRAPHVQAYVELTPQLVPNYKTLRVLFGPLRGKNACPFHAEGMGQKSKSVLQGAGESIFTRGQVIAVQAQAVRLVGLATDRRSLSTWGRGLRLTPYPKN